MIKEDVKDTPECRKTMISYIEYLEKDGEFLDNGFLIYVSEKILSKSSLIALKEVLEKVTAKLSIDVDNKFKTKEQAEVAFNQARDKAFKHCLILELKHNVSKTIDLEKIEKKSKAMDKTAGDALFDGLGSTISMLLKKHIKK